MNEKELLLIPLKLINFNIFFNIFTDWDCSREAQKQTSSYCDELLSNGLLFILCHYLDLPSSGENKIFSGVIFVHEIDVKYSDP